MSYGWFDSVNSGDGLQQGDLFLNLKIPRAEIQKHDTVEEIFDSVARKDIEGSFMILTQSCDMDPSNHKDIGSIVIAPVATLTDFVKANPAFRNPDRLKRVINGGKLGIVALNPPDDNVFNDELLIVALHHITLIDYLSLITMSKVDAYSVRYRLRSPYCEYISHHFGNLFSRVAMPGKFPTKQQIQASVEMAQQITQEAMGIK